MSESRRVYLMGFMGSGKSTIGKKLAANLGWSFVDLDREIEQKTGRTINDIFTDLGEEYFRKVEAETLRNLKFHTDTVIAIGGGTPCYGNNLEYMIGTGLTVYLRMTPGQLAKRISGSSQERPLTKNKDKVQLSDFIREKLAERETSYMKAGIIIDGKNPDIKRLKALILNHLKK